MKLFDYFLYAVVVFGWSTSWFPLKMQLGVVAPEVSLFWRFVIASFLMFVISFATRQPLRFSWRTHLRIAALGLCLFSANFTLFYYAGLDSTSGLLAVMFSMASLINVLMVAALTRTVPKQTHLMAALVGISGCIVVLARTSNFRHGGYDDPVMLHGYFVFLYGQYGVGISTESRVFSNRHS